MPHLSNKKIPVNKVNPVNHQYSQRDCFFMSLFYMILVIINRRIDKYPTNKTCRKQTGIWSNFQCSSFI